MNQSLLPAPTGLLSRNPQDANLESRRFTCYKIYSATFDRGGYVYDLTLDEVNNISRFPLGPQFDRTGQYTWAYGINNGLKC